MNEVKVECYAGFRADQRPIRFTLGERILEVWEIQDQWYSPSARYFRVLASDRDTYILRHDEEMDRWTLDAYRKK
jgi:hypothetical protein